MPTPRRLALSISDANGGAALALALLASNQVLTAAAASSAAIATGVAAGSSVFQVATQGPISLRFGLVGVAAAAVDANAIMLPVAGVYLVDAGLTATHFTHIRAGAADAIFQISPVPTQT